jgi:hypothetical protein
MQRNSPDLTNLQTIRSQVLETLANDTMNPQPSYSLDGESVSRTEWRNGMIDRIEQLNKLIQMENPFEMRTVAI